jgi:hypothetical protein
MTYVVRLEEVWWQQEGGIIRIFGCIIEYKVGGWRYNGGLNILKMNKFMENLIIIEHNKFSI